METPPTDSHPTYRLRVLLKPKHKQKTAMTKHTHPTLSKSSTRRYIPAFILSCAIGVSPCFGTGSASGWIAAANLAFTISDKVVTGYMSSETSSITGVLNDYLFDQRIEAPLSGGLTTATWYAYRTAGGSYVYSNLSIINGQVGTQDSQPFQIGGPLGQPLTKADTLTELGTPVNYRRIEKSKFSMLFTHQVLQLSNNPTYQPPAYVSVDLTFNTDKHPVNSYYGQVLTGITKTSTCSVPRGGTQIWQYPHVNHWVTGGAASTQN